MGLLSSVPELLGRVIPDFLRSILGLESQKVNHAEARLSAFIYVDRLSLNAEVPSASAKVSLLKISLL
jgi:hypothetical protein